MDKKNLYFIGLIILFSSPLIFVALIHISRYIITPNDQFFVLQKGDIPVINGSEWKLEITGQVDQELMFDYENFTILNSKKIIATLECVEGIFGTAEWEGIPLKDILSLSGVRNNAYDVVFYAEDNYSDSLTIKEASAENILLAFKMNGEILPAEHGFPIRLVAPDHYGYKWVKWIVEIELVSYDYIGFWEERGWNDQAIKTYFSSWIVHAYLFTITFVFGGLAFISGQKYGLKPTKFKELPRIVSIRFHILTSILFTIFSLIAFIYWGISTFLLRGSVFYSLHGIVGLITVILILLGSTFGINKFSKEEKKRILHAKISMVAFYLFLSSIIFGILIGVSGSIRLNQRFLF
ncbi:MAG: DUF4079 family protein [Candidatus Hodarchaeota archaeon]